MKNSILKIALVLSVSGPLAACNSTAPVTQGQAGTVAIVGAVGALAGQAIGGDTESTLIGLAAGLTAGTLIASTQNQQQCYYANGRGGYYKAAC